MLLGAILIAILSHSLESLPVSISSIPEHSQVNKLTYPILCLGSLGSVPSESNHILSGSCQYMLGRSCNTFGVWSVYSLQDQHITIWVKLFLNTNDWPRVQEEIWRQVLGRDRGHVTLRERVLDTNPEHWEGAYGTWGGLLWWGKLAISEGSECWRRLEKSKHSRAFSYISLYCVSRS